MAAKTYSSCSVAAFGSGGTDQTNTGTTTATTRLISHATRSNSTPKKKVKKDMLAKPGASQQEKMLAIQVKNTTMHLNGQNLRLAAKNGSHSKTPGLHLSATHGKETVGQLTAHCSPTQEGTAQLDLLQLKSPRTDSERQAESHPLKHPLKLTPLELPQEVKEAQWQKLMFIRKEVKPASGKLDVVDVSRTKEVKSSLRPIKATACPPVSTGPLKAQQQNTSSRPQLTRSNPIVQNGDKHLEDVMCRGTPAPLRSKPTLPVLSPRVKAQTTGGAEVAHRNSGGLQQEAGRRRPRLRRAQCLEEDQCNSNMSTGGLSADKGKLAQGVQGKGQRAERVQLYVGKGNKEPPAASQECGSVRKSHQEDCRQQSVRCTLNRQSAEGGSSERTLDVVKPSASNWRLKRKNH